MKKIFFTLVLFLGFVSLNPVLANEPNELDLTTTQIENVVEWNGIVLTELSPIDFVFVSKGVFCTWVTVSIRLYDVYFRGEYKYTVYKTFSYWDYCPGSGQA